MMLPLWNSQTREHETESRFAAAQGCSWGWYKCSTNDCSGGVGVREFLQTPRLHTTGGWAAWYVNCISTELFLKDNTEGRFSKTSTNSWGKDLDPTRIRMPSRLGGGCSDGGTQRLLIWSVPPLSMLLRFWVSLTSNKPLCSSYPLGSHSLSVHLSSPLFLQNLWSPDKT